MKACLTIFTSLFMSAALLGVMKMRRRELEKEEKQRTFLDIKLRVTLDVWSEYERQIEESNRKIQVGEANEHLQLNNLSSIEGKTGNLRSQLIECGVQEKKGADELATATTELEYHTAEYKKEEASWEKEKTDLSQLLAQQSLVCDFLKPNSEAVRNFCGDKVLGEVKKEELQAEPPKVDPPKVEPPKVDPPKVEPPKVDAPKVVAP
ncbi:unnamed protein product [Ophioblennius macclurei]